MSRRRKAEQRQVEPDPKYQSMVLARFTNRIMLGGKKSTAQRSVYNALEKLEQETNRPGIETFDQAIKNVMPAVEVKPRRVGGSTYQVPVEVRPERQLSLAIRWIVKSARSKSVRPCADGIFQELF